MILADKIISLRKQFGMSQEQLAEKLNVSRQSVSKWESAQAIPDTNKIIQLSQFFGVSIDYLLRDDLEELQFNTDQAPVSENGATHQLSLEEANAFLDDNEKFSKKIAFSVVLFTCAPILLVLSSSESYPWNNFKEEYHLLFGLIALFVFIAAGLIIAIPSAMQMQKYDYLEKEVIETQYGVDGMVRNRRDKYRPTHIKQFVLAIVLYLFSVVPLLCFVFLFQEEYMIILGVGLLLLIVAIASYLIVSCSIIWGGMQKLLEEEDYTRREKSFSNKTSAFNSIYWTFIVFLYLAYSLLSFDWGRSWMIWPIAALLFALLRLILRLFV